MLPPLNGIVIRFGNDFDFFGNQISRVESDSELSDHRNISSWGECFHESFGSRFSNGTQIVDQFLFSHTNTGVPNSQSVVGFVWNNSNSEVWFDIKFGTILVGDGLVSRNDNLI